MHSGCCIALASASSASPITVDRTLIQRHVEFSLLVGLARQISNAMRSHLIKFVGLAGQISNAMRSHLIKFAYSSGPSSVAAAGETKPIAHGTLNGFLQIPRDSYALERLARYPVVQDVKRPSLLPPKLDEN